MVPKQLANAVNVVPSLCRISTIYPIIAKPPSSEATQFIITLLPKFEVVGAYGARGTSGGIIAPFPGRDATELPIAFVALIRAKTLNLFARL